MYPVKTDGENIFISMKGVQSGGSAEIVFSGKANPGVTAADVNVEEVTSWLRLCLFYLMNAIWNQMSLTTTKVEG